MEVSGQLHSRSLYPWVKRLWYPLSRRLDMPQCQSGCGGKEKKNPYPCHESKPGHPDHSLVTVLNELPRLHIIPN